MLAKAKSSVSPPYDDAEMFSIERFNRRNSVGRSFTYGEIRAGRLKAVKAGRLTRITRQAEAEWRAALSAMPQRAA